MRVDINPLHCTCEGLHLYDSGYAENTLCIFHGKPLVSRTVLEANPEGSSAAFPLMIFPKLNFSVRYCCRKRLSESLHLLARSPSTGSCKRYEMFATTLQPLSQQNHKNSDQQQPPEAWAISNTSTAGSMNVRKSSTAADLQHATTICNLWNCASLHMQLLGVPRICS